VKSAKKDLPEKKLKPHSLTAKQRLTGKSQLKKKKKDGNADTDFHHEHPFKES
jgi:hypothetical protein